MEDVKITSQMRQANAPIPEDQIPVRYAVATNLLCSVREGVPGDSHNGLLVLNYEPEKWNQWYPFYSTVNDTKEFEARSYGDLCKEFAQVLARLDNTPQDRLAKAKEEFQKLYQCSSIDIGDSPVVEPEHWLRFSKTADMWTYYLIEFYCVTDVEQPALLLKQDTIIQAVVPLEGDQLRELHRSGKLLDTRVVENTLGLLSDEATVGKLRDCAIVV